MTLEAKMSELHPDESMTITYACTDDRVWQAR